MEQWQIDAIKELLETPVQEVEAGERVYLSSEQYGNSRFHLIDKRYDGIRIEQTNIEEKWGSKIHIQNDELPGFLKTLLAWHLTNVYDLLQSAKNNGDDALGDLDDHPF